MRIISGVRKGYILYGPKKIKIRPTLNRVKKCMFDCIGKQIIDANVLDLFSGTGSLGIEALSRGASQAIFIEKSKIASQIIRKNLQLTQFESCSQIYIVDVFYALRILAKKKQSFDLILVDPPYNFENSEKLINKIWETNVLSLKGEIIFEHSSSHVVYRNIEKQFRINVRKMGDTAVSFINMDTSIVYNQRLSKG